MTYLKKMFAAALLALMALPAAATNCATIAADLAAAAPGATVKTGPIVCPARIVVRNITREGATLDATGAHFIEGVTLSGVSGVTIKGGTYGRADGLTAINYAIAISGGHDVSVAEAKVLSQFVATPDRGGVQCRQTVRCTIRDSELIGHVTGISIYESSDFLVARNTVRPRKDGVTIADSRRGIIGGNVVHVAQRFGSDHPDCFQGWSIIGRPPQSDQWIVNNVCTGITQGYFFSDPNKGIETRMHFLGNQGWVTFGNTLTCGKCTDSEARYNVLAGWPGGALGPLPGSIKGFDGAGSVVADNKRLDGWVAPPPRVYWLGVPDLHGSVGSKYDRRDFNPVTVEVAP